MAKPFTLSKTMARASTCSMPTSCLACFSGCIAPKTTRGRGWAWRPCSASSTVTAGGCGPRARWTGAPRSISRWEGRRLMNESPVEILLVEDNPNDVELTLHALKKHHLSNHIEGVRDGVVPLDLKLPKVDCLEVLRRIKADPRTRLIPVVVLTSSREERDIVESYQLGVNSYISKPVDFEQFTEAVRQLGLYWLLLNQPPGV